MNAPAPESPVAGRVLLFSGHMIDAADREVPRFPPAAEPVARAAIVSALDALGVGPADLGLTEGACGGDLLFAEALLARGASLELRMPFREARFVQKSIAYPKKTPPQDRWLERFHDVTGRDRVLVRAMPDESAPVPPAGSPYEQCNLWMLRDALAVGAERTCFICLWNGSGGDGPGGTAHMKARIEEAGGRVTWLDTRKLWET